MPSTTPRKRLGWTPDRLRKAMFNHEPRVVAADIARQLGISRATVAGVIAGDKTSGNVAQALADALGRAVGDIFPLRKPEQSPKPVTRRRQTRP